MCGKAFMTAGKSASSAQGFPRRIFRPSLRFVLGVGMPFSRLLNNTWAPQSFLKEAVIWKRLRHPNVVPFIGVTIKPLQFVSEYMPNGTLTKYVNNKPSADRVGLVSLSSGMTTRMITLFSQVVGCGRRS